MEKHIEHLDRKKIRLVTYLSFLLGFSQSVLIYVMSSYFREVSGTENVGSFYLIAYALLIVSLLSLHKLARLLGKTSVFMLALFLKLLTLAVLAVVGPSWTGMFFLVLYVVFSGVEWVSLDVILESFSCDKESGRIRGKHLAIFNTGFLFGPLVSTRLFAQFHFSGVFVFLLIFNIALFLLALFNLRNCNGQVRRVISLRKMLAKLRSEKDVLGIYYISFALEFFYALTVIYTPLYLVDLGFSWEQIGNIFTFMLLPFVFLQYPVGALTDRKNNEKKLIIWSLFLMAFFTIGIYFSASAGIIWWSVLLFGTRIGAALVEILRDAYFYRRIDGDDVDLIDFFRTALPVGYVVAAFLSFLVIRFISLPAVFVLVAVVVLSAIYPARLLLSGRVR